MKVTLCVLSPFNAVSHFTIMRSPFHRISGKREKLGLAIDRKTKSIHFGAVVKEDEHTNNGHETNPPKNFECFESAKHIVQFTSKILKVNNQNSL